MAGRVVALRLTGPYRHRLGESHGMARYSDAMVELVAELYELGLSQRAVAALTGVPRRTVRDYVSGSRRGGAPDLVVSGTGTPRHLIAPPLTVEELEAALADTGLPVERMRRVTEETLPRPAVAPPCRPDDHSLEAVMHGWVGAHVLDVGQE